MLFSCEKPISDFQSKNFIKFFGSGYESKGNDVIELTEGGYVITGYDKTAGGDNQVYITKVDQNGNIIWEKTYGSKDCKEEGKVVKEVSDGFIIAGISLPNASSITHSFIMKIGLTGDSTSYNEFGDITYSIVINDMVVSSSNIFIAGQCNKTSTIRTETYAAKLNLSGILVRPQIYPNNELVNHNFDRVIQKGNDSLLFVGNWMYNKIAIIRSGMEISLDYAKNLLNAGESYADARLNENNLYLLSNPTLSSTRLTKLNLFTQEWQTETINEVTGKSVAYNEDGTLMVCGEKTVAGNQEINFIKVSAEGSTDGTQVFRTFSGTAGKLIATKDKGLILVGSTNSTYGVNIQLIKTDKDYFMLKNN